MATNDERIMTALLLAGSVRRAAKIADVSESTVRNRLKDETFRTEYDRQRGDLLQEATASLTARLQSATETLGAIVDDAENAASVRLSAADALLRHGLRYFGAAELERRLAALEAAQAEREVVGR